MSRVLTASSWMLLSLGLCSCVKETGVPATPTPAQQSAVPVKISDDKVNEERADAETAQQVAEENGIDEKIAVPEQVPSSGNPVIDFFRSVDRGVKSTTTPNVPTPDKPDNGRKPFDE